ncbi:MAG: hypothetical protein IID44_20740 [Planctomycetes bacterium]|nr:hypothetical protein [Planctomycetota bacterium]
MEISAVVGVDCPACQATASFGPPHIMGQFWFTRCRICNYYTDEPLPPLGRKRVIYLDQFVLGNFVGGSDPFWPELRKRLVTLSQLQLIVCPYSEVHRHESLLQHDLRDVLKDLYQSLGGEIHFRFPMEIEESQLLRSIRWFLKTGHESPNHVRVKDAFQDDPNRWAIEPTIFANMSTNSAIVEGVRAYRDSLHQGLRADFEEWHKNPRTFDEYLIEHARRHGQRLLAQYREVAPPTFTPEGLPSTDPGIMLVHWLGCEVKESQADSSEPLAIVARFLESDAFRQTPFVDISSRLWAIIAERVGKNRKTPQNAKRSDAFDVKMISRFAPYCDAMFIDRSFHAVASDDRMKMDEDFGVKVFSYPSKGEFLDYLDEILASMSDDHREQLALVQPQLTSVLSFLGRDKATQ